jgi:hypothetical protein
MIVSVCHPYKVADTFWLCGVEGRIDHAITYNTCHSHEFLWECTHEWASGFWDSNGTGRYDLGVYGEDLWANHVFCMNNSHDGPGVYPFHRIHSPVSHRASIGLPKFYHFQSWRAIRIEKEVQLLALFCVGVFSHRITLPWWFGRCDWSPDLATVCGGLF